MRAALASRASSASGSMCRAFVAGSARRSCSRAATVASTSSRRANVVRVVAARNVPRRPLLVSGVAGAAFASLGGAGAPRPVANAATVAPSVAPAVAAIRDLIPGQTLADGAFEVLSVEEVSEYSVACVELLHVATGARWMHCGADDPNNVFNVAFRTTPTDSTGVAHILEHTALCGSDRYPVRDPFFNMLRRSLSTFMNAMTAADYTCYPFSTMNETDYFNLLGVYLDAAFFPKLTREDFLQEGHRLEFSVRDDPNSELTIKGVVFNEMKGAMGSQSARFGRALSAALFPTSTYHHNSGGDPANIPELTHEDLVRFHATHYHPSNARFFTYGDLPLEPTLKAAHEKALSTFDPIDVSGLEVADEVRLTAPVRATVEVPAEAVVADPERQTTVSVAYLMVNQIKEPDADLENFALLVASDLLLSGPQAYFHEALLESGLGQGFAPGTGYSSTRRETSFAVGVKGVKEADAEKAEAEIERVLAAIARDGFPRDRVDAVMHQVELSAARVTTNFGLGVAFGAMGTWVHGGDALRSLRTPRMAERLQRELDADPRFWQRLFERRFRDNAHKVTVVGVPDAEYDAKLDAKEREAVKKIEEGLSDARKEQIVAEAVALFESQDKKQDASVLPTLVVADAVQREVKRWGSKQLDTDAGVPLQLDEQPTNGLTYASVLFDVTDLPDRLVPYLDLFADFVAELGTAAYDFKQLSQREKLKTGGVGASVDSRVSLDGTERPSLYLALTAHALDRNVPAMFDLLTEVVTSARWASEPERLGLLLSRRAASAGASVSPNGMQYAKSLANATIDAVSAIDDRASGIPHVAMLQRLAREKEDAVAETQIALAEIATRVFAREQITKCRLACQPGDSVRKARVALDAFVASVPPGAGSKDDKSGPTIADSLAAFEPNPSRAFVAVPSQTNYCVASFKTVPYAHEDAAPLFLLGQALSTAYLHREIREKGGAYGGGASASPVEGVFGMSSYRDPNTLETLAAFERAAEWAATEGNITREVLEEAHLRAFKSIDAPLAPSSRGASLFTAGLTDEKRQLFRDRLLDCTTEKMRACAEKYLVGKKPALAIVGGAQAAEALAGDGWVVTDAEGKPLE